MIVIIVQKLANSEGDLTSAHEWQWLMGSMVWMIQFVGGGGGGRLIS